MLSGSPPPDPARLFRGLLLENRASVAVAVSGGGDSVALLLLLKTYLDRLPRAPALLAITVDHRLRAGSAAEAAAVARLCAEHGIAHRVAVWDGAKPVAGLAAAAREARHLLLAKTAGEAGGDLVLTGHTLDDQAETVAMRAARGAGRGEAGIAPATLFDGRVWFARPLLAVRRADLRDWLARRGVSWIDDPTNEDLRFERARARKALDDAAVERLAHAAALAAAERTDLGARAARLVTACASRPAPGLLRLPERFAATTDRAAAVYALRILMAVAGGREHLPDAGRAAALFARLDGAPFRATLSRALVTARRDGIFLCREARNLPLVPAAAQPLAWDGRYRLGDIPDAPRIAVGALGPRAAGEADIPQTPVPASVFRAAQAAEPALWRGAECLGLAREATGVSCRPVCGPWARYMPLFDLAPARAVARLLGAPPVLEPPCASHIEC